MNPKTKKKKKKKKTKQKTKNKKKLKRGIGTLAEKDEDDTKRQSDNYISTWLTFPPSSNCRLMRTNLKKWKTDSP